MQVIYMFINGNCAPRTKDKEHSWRETVLPSWVGPVRDGCE